MQKNLLLSLLGVLLCTFAGTVSAEPQRKPTPMRPSELMCENLIDPVGIDTPFPLLSWKFTTDGAKLQNWNQTAYRILVYSSDSALIDEIASEIVWDSGWVESDQTRNIKYGGTPLQSNRTIRAGSRPRAPSANGRQPFSIRLSGPPNGSALDWTIPLRTTVRPVRSTPGSERHSNLSLVPTRRFSILPPSDIMNCMSTVLKSTMRSFLPARPTTGTAHGISPTTSPRFSFQART